MCFADGQRLVSVSQRTAASAGFSSFTGTARERDWTWVASRRIAWRLAPTVLGETLPETRTATSKRPASVTADAAAWHLKDGLLALAETINGRGGLDGTATARGCERALRDRSGLSSPDRVPAWIVTDGRNPANRLPGYCVADSRTSHSPEHSRRLIILLSTRWSIRMERNNHV
jgi:hypothetical protein